MVSPLTSNQILSLSPVEMVCCFHVNSVLEMLREQTKDRYRIVLLGSDLPDATCFSQSAAGMGQIRITTGLLSLISILAARCALIMEQGNFLIPWLPTFERESSVKEELPHPFFFGDIELSNAKRLVTDLTDIEIDDLANHLRRDVHLVRNTVRVASAAIEFLVLHEMGHFDAKHDQIKRTNKSSIDIAVQRVFEHQADIFSVRLMLALGVFRPIGEQGPLVPSEKRHRQGNNILSYLGASLSLAAITLLRSREPLNNAERSIELIRSVKAEHPLPTTRLIVADAQVQIELKTTDGRRAIWPGSGEIEAVTLRAMTEQTLFLALATLDANWRSSINTFTPGKDLPLNIRYWIEDTDDLSNAQKSLQPEAIERAMRLGRLSSSSAGLAEVGIVYKQ